MRLLATRFMLFIAFAVCLMALKVAADRNGEKYCEDEDKDNDNDNGGPKTKHQYKTSIILIGSSTVWSVTVLPTPTTSEDKPKSSAYNAYDSAQSSGTYFSGFPQSSDTDSSKSSQPSGTYSLEIPQSSASYPSKLPQSSVNYPQQESSLASNASQSSVYNPTVTLSSSAAATWSRIATSTPTNKDSEPQVGSMANSRKIGIFFMLAAILFSMISLA